MVRMDIEELISPTSLSQAPIIAVSAVTGGGLPDLISAIDGIQSSAEPRRDMGKPRLPIKAQGKVTLAEVRDLFQTSRKYAQAFLEHLDGKRITRRIGDERVLY